jgi:hypothetical protein
METGGDAMRTGRFDAWTRRRFGLGVSGLTAGLVSVVSGGDAAAKKRKQKCKKKCKKPDTCPQRFCCQCPDGFACTLLDAPDAPQAEITCIDFCSDTDVIVRASSGTETVFCGPTTNIPNQCVRVDCPIVL